MEGVQEELEVVLPIPSEVTSLRKEILSLKEELRFTKTTLLREMYLVKGRREKQETRVKRDETDGDIAGNNDPLKEEEERLDVEDASVLLEQIRTPVAEEEPLAESTPDIGLRIDQVDNELDPDDHVSTLDSNMGTTPSFASCLSPPEFQELERRRVSEETDSRKEEPAQDQDQDQDQESLNQPCKRRESGLSTFTASSFHPIRVPSPIKPCDDAESEDLESTKKTTALIKKESVESQKETHDATDESDQDSEDPNASRDYSPLEAFFLYWSSVSHFATPALSSLMTPAGRSRRQRYAQGDMVWIKYPSLQASSEPWWWWPAYITDLEGMGAYRIQYFGDYHLPQGFMVGKQTDTIANPSHMTLFSKGNPLLMRAGAGLEFRIAMSYARRYHAGKRLNLLPSQATVSKKTGISGNEVSSSALTVLQPLSTNSVTEISMSRSNSSKTKNKKARTDATVEPSGTVKSTDDQVQQLVALTSSAEVDCRAALTKYKGKLERAANALLDDFEAPKTTAASRKTKAIKPTKKKKHTTTVDTPSDSQASCNIEDKSSTSHGAAKNGRRKIYTQTMAASPLLLD